MEAKITPKAWNDGLALDASLLKVMARRNPEGARLLQTHFTRAERVYMVRDRFQTILDKTKEAVGEQKAA